MPRKILTAKKLRKVVALQVNQAMWSTAEQERVKIPMPRKHVPDVDGCNWSMDLGRVGAERQSLRTLISSVRRDYNLPE